MENIRLMLLNKGLVMERYITFEENIKKILDSFEGEVSENLTEEIPYGIKDICEEMNLTSDNIHCVIDECLNHKLSTEYTGTVWINLSNGHFVKERSGVFGC